MLSPAHRLTDSVDYRRVTRQGRRASSRTLVAYADGSADPMRVGLVVGKQVGNAVTRNRVKRRLRHIARQYVAHTPAPTGSLVIRALPAAAGASSAHLAADLDHCLAKLDDRPSA